jgi:hypothetical protein|uniref:Uncharacterized protein n=1 Tax=Populus trichocarpa TaxID=3694 RepID=A0A2K2C558_POPTR
MNTNPNFYKTSPLFLSFSSSKPLSLCGWRIQVLPPKDGFYENCSFFFSNKNSVTCRVFIDSVLIHLETDDADPSNYQGSHLLGVEFGDFRPDEDQLPVLALEFIPVIRE